jgi:hypothetical protein
MKPIAIHGQLALITRPKIINYTLWLKLIVIEVTNIIIKVILYPSPRASLLGASQDLKLKDNLVCPYSTVHSSVNQLPMQAPPITPMLQFKELSVINCHVRQRLCMIISLI